MIDINDLKDLKIGDIEIYEQICYGSHTVNNYEFNIYTNTTKDKFKVIDESITNNQLVGDYENNFNNGNLYTYFDYVKKINDPKNHLFKILSITTMLSTSTRYPNRIEADFNIKFQFTDKDYERRYKDLKIKPIFCHYSGGVDSYDMRFIYFDVCLKDNNNDIDKKEK